MYREKDLKGKGGKKRNWRMVKSSRPMDEVRKGVLYLQGVISAGPLHTVYNPHTCTLSPRQEAHGYRKQTKSLSSMWCKGQSWWTWIMRQLVTEERHDSGGRGIGWSSANFSPCVVLAHLPNITFNCLWRILQRKYHTYSRVLWED